MARGWRVALGVKRGIDLVGAAVGLVRRSGLLPEAYLYGFLRFLAHTEARPAFLWGERSETGWWYYFPVSFALKTPLPLIVLLAVAVVVFLFIQCSRGEFRWGG